MPIVVLRDASLCNTGPVVGQVIGTFGRGGAQRLAYNLASGLGDMGVRSLAIALRSPGKYAQEVASGVSLVCLNARRYGVWGLMVAVVRLRQLICREHVDALHVHGSGCLPFVILATRALGKRPKILFTWQDSESVLEQRGWRRRAMIWALQRCAGVHGSSRLVAKKVSERAAVKRVGVFHGGVPVVPHRERRSVGAPIILWVGRFVPPKDPWALLRAAARLKGEGRRFLVYLIGGEFRGGTYQEETRKLIDKLDLCDVVRAPGYVEDDELTGLMRSASPA